MLVRKSVKIRKKVPISRTLTSSFLSLTSSPSSVLSFSFTTSTVSSPPISPTSSSTSCTGSSITPQPLCLTNIPLGKFQDIYTSLGKPLSQATQIWQATMQQYANSSKDLSFLSVAEQKEWEALNIGLRNKDIGIRKELISKDKTVKWLLDINHNFSSRSSSASSYPDSEPDTSSSSPLLSSTLQKPVIMNENRTDLTSTSSSNAIEMVYIPENGKQRNKPGRGTLCVSSQIGCSLACKFCHTGTQRMQGNLRTMDIVEQVLISQERIKVFQNQAAHHHNIQPFHKNSKDNANQSTVPSSLSSSSLSSSPFPSITNIVFMGQGEPLLNYRNVSQAIRILTHPRGLKFPSRRITISTSGIAPNIPRIAKELPGVRLALSLHAPTNTLRTQLMNINQQYSIQQVMEACQEYIDIRLQSMLQQRKERSGIERTNDRNDHGAEDDDDDDDISLPRFRNDRHNGNNRIRVSFEYAMLRDINDTPTHAIALAKLFKKYLKNPFAHAHVNLIPFNPWPNAPYQCSPMNRITDFQRVLNVEGINTTIRRSRGQDILGACGQLRSTALRKS